MKNSKLAKFGIVSLSVLALGVVAPVVAPVTFGGSVVYAEEQAGTVIHIGEEPTSPENDTSLFYTIEHHFGNPNDGVGWVTEEKPNINEGEIHEVEGLSETSKAWTTYRIIEGTPESYTITYDDVRSGKTHYVFRLYNTETHNPDGSLKNSENTETPAEQPQTPPESPTDKPAEQPAPTDTPANKPETPAEEPAEPAKPGTPANKPAENPSDKPAEEPANPMKPMDKPMDKPVATKPTDTNKPVVKPADTGKPEVKPENKIEPKAEVKPAQQSGTAAANAQTSAPKADTKAPATAAPKADKPAEKKMETLPNTGESDNSIFLALGALLAFVATKLFSFRKKS